MFSSIKCCTLCVSKNKTLIVGQEKNHTHKTKNIQTIKPEPVIIPNEVEEPKNKQIYKQNTDDLYFPFSFLHLIKYLHLHTAFI